MVPTTDLNVFIAENDLEFRDMVANLCEYLRYPGSPDDVVQDLYVRFLTVYDVIALFDQSRGVLISSYLFKVVQNYIISCFKGHEGSFHRYRLSPFNLSEKKHSFESSVDYFKGNDDYEINAHCNNADNRETPLHDDFQDFELNLSYPTPDTMYALKRRSPRTSSENKIRALDNLKNEAMSESESEEIQSIMDSVEENGCTLLDIFHLLYKGYTNVQIAEIYGVSTTTVTRMKTGLASAILQYGIKI